MPDYRRNRVPDEINILTVNLLNRNSRLLVEYIEILRAPVRQVRVLMPFHIDAWGRP